MSTANNTSERFRPHTGNVAQTGLHYLSAGKGEPVVLLHGWGGFKEMWWATMQALSPYHHVIAFDWPGHGSSVPLEAGLPVLDALTDLALASSAALGLRGVTLVGHSLGGNVAARVALARPDLVARLALIDAVVDPGHLPATSWLFAHPRIGERALRFGRLISWPLSKLGSRIPHEHGGGFLRPLARRQSRVAQVEASVLFAFLAALREGSLADRLSEIVQPTLILAGERDPLVRPRQARDLAQEIPHAQLCLLRGAYHCPMDEQPAAFHRALIDFLRVHPLES
jgi:pimeloyl-ACP methyl ester carboxylesterase